MNKVATLYRILFSLLTVSFLWPCSCGLVEKPEEAVIVIGDISLGKKEVQKEIERMILDMGITDKDVRTNIKPVINKIVEKKLILEYGQKNGISISEEELGSAEKALRKDFPDDVFKDLLLERYVDYEEWKKNLGEELLITKIINAALADSVTVSYEETKDYYGKHQEEFRHLRMVQVRQIVTKTKKEMETVLDLIKKGSSIRELARDYSIAPEAEEEGMMGWVSEGELDETIDNFIFSLKIGEVSKILESPYGFHVFRIIDAKEEGIKEFPETVREIESKISMEKREVLFKKWLESLKKKVPVSINEKQILADMDMEG